MVLHSSGLEFAVSGYQDRQEEEATDQSPETVTRGAGGVAGSGGGEGQEDHV